MGWNDSAPDAIGLEWFVQSEGVVALDSPTATFPIQLEATATETIDQLIVAHKYANPGAAGYARHWVDVYDAASTTLAPGLTGITELRYAPNEDKARSNTTRADFATTTNLYAQVDETDDGSGVDSDYVVNASTGSAGSYFAVQFGTAAIPNTWRIVYVKFEVRCKGFDWSWQQPKIYLDWYNNSTLVGRLPGSTLSPPQDYTFRTTTLGPYYFDFYNEGLWLQPEIVNLDTNTSRNLRVVMDYACAVSRITMVVGVIPENRAAVGITAGATIAPTGVQSNTPLMVKTPLNVDNWAKASGTDYVALVRRLEHPLASQSTLTSQMLTLDSGLVVPYGQGQVYAGASMDTSGVLSSVGAVGTKAAGVVLGTSGGASSVDEQPYYDLVPKLVYWDSGVAQQVSGATNTNPYRRMRALVAVKNGLTPADGLHFGVRKSASPDVSDAFAGSISAAFTAGTFAAGAAASAASGQLVYTTGTTADAYARHRTTNAQSPNFELTGKVTFASIASAHYGLIYVRGSSTFGTGIVGLTSSYDIAMVANGSVALYRVDASGVESLVLSRPFAFTTAQHSFRVLCLSNGFIGFKVWATAGAEPAEWNFSTIDTLYTGDYVALAAQNDSAGGSSRTVSFDDFSLTNMEAVGDLAYADLADSTIATRVGTAVAHGSLSLDIYDVTVTMDASATLAAATGYTFDMQSVSDPTNGWYAMMLDSASTHGLSVNQTYDGATSGGLVGSGSAPDYATDFPWTFGTIPAAPASISVSVLTTEFDNNGGALCDAGSLSYAHVDWAATSLGASFDYYEVQRSYDSGTTWEAAATINTEATSEWDNKELRRGVAVKYRVRVVRSDTAVSDWTTQSGTTTVPQSSGVLAFVSDADASVIAGYVLLGPQRTYKFLNRTVYSEVDGRDFALAFKDYYQRGFTWDFRVLIYVRDDTATGGTPVYGAGVGAFDGIRAIADADVPYLALITPDGEVLCGSIDVPEGPRAEPGHYYEAVVSFRQTQSAPSAVSI